MALDLNTPLAEQLGSPLEPEVRSSVALLLLAVVHDCNGHLGAAMLRSRSSRRTLDELQARVVEGKGAESGALFERVDTSLTAIADAHDGLRALLADIASAAWKLEGGLNGRVG